MKPVLAITPLLLGAETAAAYCGIAKSTWESHDKSGDIPAPRWLGGRKLWDRLELEAWSAAGCPGRAKWEEIQKATQPGS